MKTIEKVQIQAPIVYRRKRVAAYCRVSIESERMHHSLSAQISYYNDLIQKNPDWEFAGVFADYGASGTATKDRTEFNRMLDECEAGKIDIILTKSVTRFARNTVDLLSTVRHLKELGIEVRFEKEGINSLSGDGELMLTVLASFAQEESRSISENCKYPFTRKIRCSYCGYHFTRKLTRLNGKSYSSWICRCKKEVGKTCTSRNYRELDLERISAHILGDATFDAESFNAQVKEMIALPGGDLEFHLIGNEVRVWKDLHLDDVTHIPTVTPAFTGKFICGKCGQPFLINRKTGQWVYWKCRGKRMPSVACNAENFSDYHLRQISAYMMGLNEFDEQAFDKQIKLVRVLDHDRLEYHFTDGRVELWERV